MDIKEIQNLIKFVAKSGASEVKLEMDDFKITIKTGSEQTATTIVHSPAMQNLPQVQAAQPMVAPTVVTEQVSAEKPVNSADDSKFITVKSPMIGTFYRKPSPDKPNFVEVGSKVKVGDTVCVIEAMKLFNEIESDIAGKIVKVLVDDSSPVEFDQPLFLVDPS
ncbi:MAG: acetyl-CoA carboxylase biotin carboxyl carrier protein [Polaribacter sp.]|nr:acetyl-CoA carboxylase biotin carboxyl carrier protein [Polaribacter sp.]